MLPFLSFPDFTFRGFVRWVLGYGDPKLQCATTGAPPDDIYIEL